MNFGYGYTIFMCTNKINIIWYHLYNNRLDREILFFFSANSEERFPDRCLLVPFDNLIIQSGSLQFSHKQNSAMIRGDQINQMAIVHICISSFTFWQTSPTRLPTQSMI